MKLTPVHPFAGALQYLLPVFLTGILLSCQYNRDDENNEKTLHSLLLLEWLFLDATTIHCTEEQINKVQNARSYSTDFEDVQDFDGFYFVPQNYQDASSHALSTEQKNAGTYSHKAWIYSKGPDCIYPQNCNHRGYPTIQLHKLPSGGFKTPVLVQLYTYLDMNLASNDWFSFMTLSADRSDAWKRVVLVNTDSSGSAYLMHVPNHNEKILTYQNASLNYPQRQWVKLEVCLDLDPSHGFARVRQNGTLLSTAEVKGGCGVLEQAHFGLYASPGLSSGSVFNDSLRIEEIPACPW